MKLIFSLALIVMANKKREKYKFERVFKNYDYQRISSLLLILKTLTTYSLMYQNISPTCLNCSSKLQFPWLLPPPAPPTGLLLCEFGVGGCEGGLGRGGNGPSEDGGRDGGIRGPDGGPFPNCLRFANNA